METNTHKTLPLKTKWLFASGDFAKTLLVVMTMGFSLYFYTDIIGINPAIASTIILIAKIWDFVNDPMMGTLVDRTKSKEGKCRIWFKYMAVPGGIVLALNFIVPELSMSGKIVWFAIVYTLQGMASTALQIPQNILMSRITTDEVERAQINSFRGYFSIAANLIAGSFAIPFVMLAGNNDMRKGFAILGIVCGILYTANYILLYVCTRGYEPVEEEIKEEINPEIPKEKVNLGDVITNAPWLFALLSYFIVNLAISAAGSSGVFYAQYNLGNINIYSVMNFIAIGGSVLVYPFLSRLVAKFGSAKLIVIGNTIAAAGYLFRYFTHDANLGIIYGGYFVGTFGQCLASAVVILVVFDSFIYMAHKTGKKVPEGVLVSGFSVAYKVGMAIGAPISGWLLAAVPYVAGAESQEESVLNMFFNMNTLIPAAGFIVALIFGLILLKFDKQVQEYKALDAAAAKEQA
ncbi:MAG: MFS transporter [Mogibacterium sp.]|nr:MFS transporter [Mogibacterium sp.]